MKRPVFNAQQFTGAITGGPTNNTEVTGVDSSENMQIINISPIAKRQLLHLLLAAAPIGVLGSAEDEAAPKNILQAKGIRTAVKPGYEQVLLEVSLGPNIAIHIALPGNVADDLFEQLVDREAMKAPPKTGQH